MVPTAAERLPPTPLDNSDLPGTEEATVLQKWAHSGDQMSQVMSLPGLPLHVGCSPRLGAGLSKLLLPSGPCPASPSCMPGTRPPKGSHGVFCIRRHTLPEADREKLPWCLGVLGCN